MMACTSPLFTVRSRPLRISLPSTVTCRFLISSSGTSCLPSSTHRLKCEMISAISSFLLRFLVAGVDRTERSSAHVDLALLADHDHHSFRVDALLRLLQQRCACRRTPPRTPLLLQLLRRREVGIEELLQKRARRAPAARAARRRPWRACASSSATASSSADIDCSPSDAALSRPSLRG